MKNRFLFISFVLLIGFSCGNDDSIQVKKQDEINQDTVNLGEGNSKAYKDPTLPPNSDYSGDHVVKYPTGITNIRGFFRFGKKHGKWASFYPSGQLQSETEFDNGIRKGKSTVWYENGKVMYQGEYKNDNRFGMWTSYDSSGTLLETKKY
ncbi:MAG: toxin-antitoxin system YwqK family antitoxin [Bacteroidota bacterium]|jgi:antitoxin component YwqK of YwqJK toxin-antitoxin module